jgi:hypothetical protein
VKHKRCDSEKFISNNDNPGRSAMGLYIQRKERGRELDSGETERQRERESERYSIALRRCSVSTKINS